jgi:hypothetical protein
MAQLAIVSPARVANVFAEASAAAGGDEFANTGKELLVIEHVNGGGSNVTLTIVTPQTVDGLAVADKAIVIAPGTRQLLGPFPKGIYNDEDDNVNLTYSAHTDIRVAVLRPS